MRGQCKGSARVSSIFRSTGGSLQPLDFSLAAAPTLFSMQCWPSPVLERRLQSLWAQHELL